MDQRKIGSFLQQLRKEKGLTQEQLAEHFYVSSRTVSRWETGTNMPDLDMLIDIADFYDVDIYEIIDGERKSENLKSNNKITIKKVVEYASRDKKVRNLVFRLVMACAMILMLICAILFGEGIQGILYGTVPESICDIIVLSSGVLGFTALVASILESSGAIDKVISLKNKKR